VFGMGCVVCPEHRVLRELAPSHLDLCSISC